MIFILRTSIATPNTQLITHEAFWEANGVYTKIAFDSRGCQGVSCPFRTPNGYGFRSAVRGVNHVPVVCTRNPIN